MSLTFFFKQYGYMLVDGCELFDGNIYNEEDEVEEDDTTSEEETEDYQIEDGYTIVSKINNFDTYTGNTECSYLINGSVEDNTAYSGNSWGITENKDKYTDDFGGVVTGGIWIGGSLNSSTQSGIRFWYKSSASCTVSLRSSTFGKGGMLDYIVSLPAAPEGAWKTLHYRDIEKGSRKVTDFKYIHVKITNAPVYIDEVHTVFADSIIYTDREYKIADIAQEQNNNYPVIDEYVFAKTIDTFNSDKGEFGYLVNGTVEDGTAYSENSWGVTENKDKYVYTDENGSSYWSYGIVTGSFDADKYEGIRFWYKSEKECKVSFREQFYGQQSDYVVTLPAAKNGTWYTVFFGDFVNAGKDISQYICMFVKTCDSPSVYIDELHYIKLAENIYTATETVETARGGQKIKTVSATRDITENNKSCTLTRETNSVGANTLSVTENETGNQISATDGNGNTVNYSYDDLNNLIEMSQTVDTTDVNCKYTYLRGQISTIESHGVTYTYDYTPFGELKSISVGDTALVTYTYISNQNRTVSKVTYANGQSINYTYTDDALTKMVSKDSEGTVTNTITYDNDETGAVLKTKDSENGTVTKTVNDITQVWNTAETKLLYSYSSDEDKLVETINGTEFKTNYSETSDSTIEETNVYETVKTTSYGNTTVTVYSDLFGRTLKEVTKSGNTIVLLKVYEYNSNGNYTTEQIKSVTTTVGTSDPETIRYTYDNNGNITGIYSKIGDGEETTVATYEYDELNQLVKENDKSYTYDFGGNIQTAGNNTYSYSTGEWKDKLTSFNGEEITYDESGNPLNYLGATLTWKNGRSLATYTKDDLSITYKYNTDGLRTQKTVVSGDTTTTYNYTWNGSNLTHQSWDSKYIHFYYDNSGSILGFTYYNGASTADYSYVKNIQGDVIGISDSEGNTVATYTYDACGNKKSSASSK